MILFNIFFLLVPCFAADLQWFNDRFENMTADVQTHFQTVLNERYTRLYWDMYQSCNDTYRPQAVIHLNIINSQEDVVEKEDKDRMVHWAIKEPPCSINVYSTKDEVLQAWCQEMPGRMLTFPYRPTKADFWTNDPNFLVVIQSRCYHFQEERDEPPRLPLPSPFDIRQDRFVQFMIYLVPSVLVFIFLIFSCYYCTDFFAHHKTQWATYWEQREWEDIRDIIEYRHRLISEEMDEKLKEKIKNEQKMGEETKIEIEEASDN
ncbi:hypothetical protein CAEBREN_05691 [Caenorhabditis brenneri]|uniref:Uncharacterized protein n=1 Tax=Caenorhabditis brenneri TaxID=135651 RepID=G0NPN6_CAEBE|nr:hypothetical protein CAEBREN_05691 [Caenorhabditis brenneri]